MSSVGCFSFVEDQSAECSDKVALQVLSGSDHPMLRLLKRLCTASDTHQHCRTDRQSGIKVGGKAWEQCSVPRPWRGLVSVGTHVPKPEPKMQLLLLAFRRPKFHCKMHCLGSSTRTLRKRDEAIS